MPSGKKGTEYWPSPLVLTVRRSPVSAFFAATGTFGITAPAASLTVPLSVPVTVWADAEENTARNTTTNPQTIDLVRVLPIFALANAGVAWSADVFQENAQLMGAITLGLVVGKSTGIARPRLHRPQELVGR